MINSYKFRLYPTEEQKVLLGKHFGHTRFTYNWALEYKTKYYVENKKSISWMQLTKSDIFFDFKKENIWLKEVNSQSLISAIGNLDKAYTNFFEGRSNFPKFKAKYNKQSFQVPQHGKLDIENSLLHIPKFKGGIKTVFHRKIPKGKQGTYTIEKTKSEKYFVSILVHTEIEPMIKPIPKNAIGLDFGMKTFITTSEGESINSPLFLKKTLEELARKRRKFSKRIKGSKNRNKQQIIVAKLHEKIANQRMDFLHKLSHKFICENKADTICIEDLTLSGMKKLWGRKVSDLSWCEFTRQLEYKADWYGKNVIKIGRFDPSSKMCSECGHIYKELALNERKWTCKKCNHTHNRDINAAINIRNFGMQKYQLGREPTEVTPLERKALVNNGINETILVSGEIPLELGKKKVIRIYNLKHTDL